jgi:hypothetical protein
VSAVDDLAVRMRVRSLLEAARRVALRSDTVEAIQASSGLSREGVALGLSRCLEVDATDENLGRLISTAVPTSSVHVILSSNVFTAPLRALAVACAASARVSVRPSRRDPFFTRALVREAEGAGVTLAEDQAVSGVLEGEIHAYGRDETIASVRREARAEVRVRGHGSGLGIAFVGLGATLDEAARALAEDVVVFDQRGCCSPRVAFVRGADARAADFAEALGHALAARGRTVPRGRLDDAERRDAARYIETMAFAGRTLRGDDYVVGIARRGSPIVVPPVGRHVQVIAVDDSEGARHALTPIDRFVVALGCDDEAEGRALLTNPERVRCSSLGQMQSPPLDGPIDLREL